MSSHTNASKLLGSDTPIPELITLENKMNKLIHLDTEGKADSVEFQETVQLIIVSIIDLLRKNYSWLTSVEYNKRQSFLKFVIDKLNPLRPMLEQKVSPERLTELDDQLSTLKLLCDTKFNITPLNFIQQCLTYMNQWNDYEQKLLRRIHDINQIDELEDILKDQSNLIKNGRKKIVLAFLGSLKSTKSSLVNFLLQEEVCPTAHEPTTARLTKITYGEQIRLIRMTNNGQQLEPLHFHDIEQLLIEAKKYIKLPFNERLIECRDEIIIELPMNILKNVELWDIPGFDENQVINDRVKEIIDDADLIFALIPHQDSLKKSFQDFIKPRLKKYRQDFSDIFFNISTDNYCQATMICFVIAQIDTFTVNNQTKKTRTDVLEDLYKTLETQLEIKFETCDMQLCNNFIPLCTHHRFNVKTFLECRQMFIDKSNQWFHNAAKRLMYFRLNYLLDVLQQLFEYGDASRKIEHCKKLKRVIAECYQEIESFLPSVISKQLEPVKADVLKSVTDVMQDCEALAYQKNGPKIEDIIKEKAIKKFMDSLKDRETLIRQGTDDLLKKYTHAPELSPTQAQLYEQIMAETDLNPYRLGVGYYEHACTFGQQELALFNLTFEAQWIGCGMFLTGGLLGALNPGLIVLSVTGWLLAGGHAFVSIPFFGIAEKLAKLFNVGIKDRLEDAWSTCVNDVYKAFRDNIIEVMLKFSKSRLQIINSKIDERTTHLETLSETQIQKLKAFVDENKRPLTALYVDLLHEQFHLIYPHCSIDRNNQLGESNFEIFGATLQLLNLQTVDAAAKRIPLQRFQLQEVRYLKQLCHPNIVRYYGVMKSQTEKHIYYLIMDRMNCDSATYFQRDQTLINENEVLSMFDQITNALIYIDELDLVHRDIKPANILVKTEVDKQPSFHLADFGFVHRDPVTHSGTDGYAAPEIYNSKLGPITHKSDVYSWGVTMEKIIYILPHNVRNSDRFKPWKRIIDMCKQDQPSLRPSCKEFREIQASSQSE